MHWLALVVSTFIIVVIQVNNVVFEEQVLQGSKGVTNFSGLLG
jgi:hypothetical protein